MSSRCKITEILEARSKPQLAILGICLLILIVIVDCDLPSEISVDVFYLLPVGYFSWFFSRKVAVVTAFVSAVLLIAVDEFVHVLNRQPANVYWNALTALALFLLVSYIVREIQVLYERERERSNHDPLTGIANRRCFLEALSAEAERARRYGLTTTLVYLDLDNFKAINDHHGHHIGDALLKLTAQILQNSLRATDKPARLGGDEYAILMPQTDAEGAERVLRKLQASVLDEMHNHHWPITFSVGVVTYLRPPASVEEMIAYADRLMYAAKTEGKNRIVQMTWSDVTEKQWNDFRRRNTDSVA